MSRRAKIALAGALALVASGATAQQAGERLYLEIACQLPGWSVVPEAHTAEYELTSILPKGQSLKDWTDRVTVLNMFGKPTRSPEQLLQEHYLQAEQDCESVVAGPFSPQMQNGYATAMRAFACTKSKKWGKGEVDLYKAIRGNDATYLVVRAWSGPPFPKDKVPVTPDVTLKWVAFMQSVTLCDTRDPQHACPPPSAHCVTDKS